MLKFSVAAHLWHGRRYEQDGKSKVEATVKTHKTSWPKMAQFLCKLHAAEKKEKSPYMVFAEFKNKGENGEYIRQNTNVQAFHGCVLDLDEGEMDFDEIKEALDNLNLNYVLYTTHSYDEWTEGKEFKFRVVVPYADSVSPAEQPTIVVGFADMIGVGADFDNCSKTASQPMYLHSAPKARKDQAMVAYNIDGEALDHDKAYNIGEMLAGTERGAYVPKAPMGDQLDTGDRHNQFARHMSRRRKDGLSLEEVMGELYAWNNKLSNPLPDDQLEGMRRVWTSFDRNRNASGYQEHKERIDQLPLQQKEIYDSVMQHIADSADQLNAADRKELFGRIKNRRPGITLKAIEEDYRELSIKNEESETIDLAKQYELFYKRVKRELSDLVWLSDINAAYKIADGKYIKKESFQNKLIHLWGKLECEFRGIAMAAKGLPLSLGVVLTKDLMVIVDDIIYIPDEPKMTERLGHLYYNTYEPVVGMDFGDPANCLNLDEYFEYLFPSEDDRELMKDWIGCLVQQPQTKIRWVPVVYTALEQMGKDLLRTKLIEPILGQANVGQVTADYLQERYTEALTGKQLILLQEMDFGRDRRVAEATANRLKPFITESRVQLRRFGIQGGLTEHFSNYLAYTNYADAAYMEGGGMRYYLIEGPRHRKPKEWYAKQADWFVENTEDSYAYFLERDLSNFDAMNVPTNRRTKEMQKHATGWPANILNEAIDNGELEGLSALPWQYFAHLIGALTPMVDLDKVDKLTQRGGGRFQQNVINLVAKFGFHIVEAEHDRGLCFDTPTSEHDPSKRRWQKVVSFPGFEVNKNNVLQHCHDSVDELDDIITEITAGE